MHEFTTTFSANGFPLWIALLGLAFAAIRLRRVRGADIQPFDREATVPLRGALVALVALGHLKANCSWATEWLPWVGWQTPAVAVFFFLSGYGLCRGFSVKGDEYLSGFLTRSFGKLLRPLLPVVVIYSLWLQLQGQFIPLFVKFWHDGNTPVPNTWYVYALLIMYVLWWGAWRFFRHSTIRLIALWIGVLIYFCVMEFVLDWNFVWARTILAFPIGATFAVYERKILAAIAKSPLKVYLLVIVLLVAAIVVRASFPYGIVAIAGRGLTSTLGIFVILTWYAIPLPDLKVLRFLGGISYELYLVHGVVIAVAYPLLSYGFGVFAIVVLSISLLMALSLNWLTKAKVEKLKGRTVEGLKG